MAHKKVTENELVEKVEKILEKRCESRENFLECCNNVLGTHYSKEDVKWGK